MEFKPGDLSHAEARELNKLAKKVERLDRITVAGPTLRIYRTPSNIVIESIAAVPAASGSGVSGSGEGSGSGNINPNFVTVCFEQLIDVSVNITAFEVTCVDGKISATLSLETVKTFNDVCITGPDLSIEIT